VIEGLRQPIRAGAALGTRALESLRFRLDPAIPAMRNLALPFTLLLAGCAVTAPSPPPQRAPITASEPPDFSTACARLADHADIPKSLLWFRTAAEQRGAFEQAFRLAATNLESFARGQPAGSWVVVADADETLIDNGPYECELELRGLKKNDSTLFALWVEARASAATPGAAAFSARVHALGGRLIVVSNRDEQPHLRGTIDTLTRDGIEADAVLLSKTPDDRDKNRRFEAIRQSGVPEKGIPPSEILLWLGDNIQDFPQLTQKNPGDLAEFGHRYIVLPNPMYGSFVGNRLR